MENVQSIELEENIQKETETVKKVKKKRKSKRLKKPIYKVLLFIIYSLVLFAFFRPYSEFYLKSIGSYKLSIDDIFLHDFDWIQQGIPYYREFFRLLDQHSLQWSWNEFLGTAFYASKATYVIGDPFAWLGYSFYKWLSMDVPTVLFVTTIIKLLIAGLGFEHLLEKFNDKQIVTGALGICFMLGGWAVVFLEQVYFLSFYALIPFVLLGLEMVIEKNSYFLFLFAITLCLTTNLYLSWSLCFFMVLYWFMRTGVKRIKEVGLVTRTIFVFFIFGIAFALSMIVTFPGIKVLLASPRLDYQLTEYSSWSKLNICAIVMNFFIPIIDSGNLLYHDYWYYFFQIGIYCGSLALICVPQLFFQKRPRSEKIWYGLFLGIILLLLVSPVIGKILNLSYSLRYTYYVEIALLLLCAVSLQKEFNKIVLWITAILLVGIISILLFVTSGITFADFSEYKETEMLITVAVIILIYALALSFEKKVSLLKGLCVIATACEVFYFSGITLATRTTHRVSALYLEESDNINEVYSKLKKYDNSFYRVNLLDSYMTDVDPVKNASMYYGIPGISGYDSVYNYSTHEFLVWACQYPEINWNFSIDNQRLFETVGAKYTIATVKTEDKVGENAELIPELSDDFFKVYRNTNVNGLARIVHNFEPISEMRKMSENSELIEKNRITLSEHLDSNTIVSDELYSVWRKKYGDGEDETFDMYLEGTDVVTEITLEKASTVQFAIPADSGWKLYIDDVRTLWETADGGFIISIIHEGTHKIRFTYETQGFEKGKRYTEYSLIVVGGWITIAAMFWVLKKRHLLEEIDDAQDD